MEAGVTCVVPARLGSTRFFGKLLQPLAGKPVVLHSLERAAEAACFDSVICVTDSPEIAAVAAGGGFASVLTGEAANGTERIARALPELPGDLFVNLQGDEPAFPPEALRRLRDALLREPGSVHLLVHDGEPTPAELANPNRVKVLVADDGSVLDFVRVMPADAPASAKPRLQSGAYAYGRPYLVRYAATPPSAAERALSHEILRAPGLAPLRAHPCPSGASVDAPEDLEAATRALEELFRSEPIPQGTAS